MLKTNSGGVTVASAIASIACFFAGVIYGQHEVPRLQKTPDRADTDVSGWHYRPSYLACGPNGKCYLPTSISKASAPSENKNTSARSEVKKSCLNNDTQSFWHLPPEGTYWDIRKNWDERSSICKRPPDFSQY